MEDYQDIEWTRESRSRPHYLPYGRVLPRLLMAEYCSDDVPTIASVLASFIESESEPLVKPIEPTRPSQADDEEDYSSFEWVAENADDLYKQYPDTWILVEKSRVIGSAPQPQELMQLALELGIKEPFVTITTPPEKPGKAIYVRKVI